MKESGCRALFLNTLDAALSSILLHFRARQQRFSIICFTRMLSRYDLWTLGDGKLNDTKTKHFENMKMRQVIATSISWNEWN